jgi:catechol 2,3-dioxygenase-like lactoylglutathione lyase family enzyme
MIIALDHIVLLCPAIADGQRIYEALLGRAADWQTIDPAGYASVYFQLDGIALELIAPHGDGPLADKLRLRLQQEGPGLQSIALSSDALEADRKTLERRALKPTEISAGQSKDLASGLVRQWTKFRLHDESAGGLRLFVLQRSGEDPLVAKPALVGSVIGLDHLVITTANPDRAVALFGARLGLALGLDLSSAERDLRLMSFKAGKSAVELSHRLSNMNPTAFDKFWGITWRVNDIDAAHKRLSDAGVHVSDVRQGMRKATQVFTVRDGTLNVPTLFLSNT